MYKLSNHTSVTYRQINNHTVFLHYSEHYTDSRQVVLTILYCSMPVILRKTLSIIRYLFLMFSDNLTLSISPCTNKIIKFL